MNTAPRQPLLQIQGLQKSYHKRPVLKGINLNIYAGETIIIMGPSGCGKSTLVRCINRLTEPDDGRIIFDGVEVTSLTLPQLSGLRRRIGFVFQQFNLIRRLNVLENVAFALRIYGQEKAEAEDRAIRVLARVGLKERALNYPAELSGGEQQRVGIARALALEPQLMLWDEPTAALDPILVGEVIEIMEDLVRKKETTMLVVTHEVGFASRAADRIIFMDQGLMVEEGHPDKVFSTPRSEIAKKYKKLLKT
ncbi:MAG: amino acid ABC transporter ATP-binding protein [Firmicutes bacterium]|nr:amino acid ABC transporter ATP-binding protein [Bacillota bacterium]